jgi:hypothetical protein
MNDARVADDVCRYEAVRPLCRRRPLRSFRAASSGGGGRHRARRLKSQAKAAARIFWPRNPCVDILGWQPYQ